MTTVLYRLVTTIACIVFPLQPLSAWTMHLSFEGGRRGQVANGETGFGPRGAFAMTRFSAAEAYSGAMSAKAAISQGTSGLGSWGAVVRFRETLHEDETLRLLVHVFLPQEFNRAGDGRGLQLVRIPILSPERRNEGQIDISVDPDSGKLNVHNSVPQTPFPLSPQARQCGVPLAYGKWHAIELQVTLAAQRGRGVVRVWQNEKLVFEDKVHPTLRTPFSQASHAFLLGYWPGGSPATQGVWLDDVVATNEQPQQQDRLGNARIWPFGSQQ